MNTTPLSIVVEREPTMDERLAMVRAAAPILAEILRWYMEVGEGKGKDYANIGHNSGSATCVFAGVHDLSAERQGAHAGIGASLDEKGFGRNGGEIGRDPSGGTGAGGTWSFDRCDRGVGG